MNYKPIGLLLLLCTFLACDEETYEKKGIASIAMPDGKTLYYHKDSVITISPKEHKWRMRISDIPYDSIVGTNKTTLSEYRVKVQLAEDFLEKGLKRGVTYWAKIVDCTVYIPCRSNETVVTFVSNKNLSGFLPTAFKKPFLSLGSSEIRAGYNNSGDVEFHTYVLRLDYADGMKLNSLYFPCTPDSLVWSFIRYRKDNNFNI